MIFFHRSVADNGRAVEQFVTMTMTSAGQESSKYTPITSLLKSLQKPQTPIRADEIAEAFSLIFEDRLSPAQAATFLTLLSLTSRDKDPDVLAACADRMRKAAYHVDLLALENILKTRRVTEGTYRGGLVQSPALDIGSL